MKNKLLAHVCLSDFLGKEDLIRDQIKKEKILHLHKIFHGEMKERSLSHHCLSNSAGDKESLKKILVDLLRFKKENP